MPKLFKLLNEKETEPYLLFLSDKNKYWNSIRHSDITDICNSFEREYSKFDAEKRKNEVKDAKELYDYLIETIDAATSSEISKNKAKNLLGALKNFSPSLKEKIIFISDSFWEVSKAITQQPGHDSAGIKFYTKDEFHTMIKKFIQIRNKVAHHGIMWNEGTDIFRHLELFIYYCILRRAGYTDEESTNILKWLFTQYL